MKFEVESKALLVTVSGADPFRLASLQERQHSSTVSGFFDFARQDSVAPEERAKTKPHAHFDSQRAPITSPGFAALLTLKPSVLALVE